MYICIYMYIYVYICIYIYIPHMEAASLKYIDSISQKGNIIF